MTYEELLLEAFHHDFGVIEKPLKLHKGRIIESNVAIKKDIEHL